MSGAVATITTGRVDCQHPQSHAPMPPSGHHDRCQAPGHHHQLPAASAGGVRPRQERALRLSLIISLVMMVIELISGWISGSLLLLSDGIHMFAHVVALGIGLLAFRLAKRPCGEDLPFGLYRLEVIGALLNGIGLVGLSAWIVYEGIERLLDPVAIAGGELILVASAGLIVNLVSALILHRAGAEDLNTRGAWYHLMADAISSLLVLVGVVVYLSTGWLAVDPLLSILVAVLVGKWAIGLLKDATVILLERKPDHIDLAELNLTLHREFPEILHIHDLHVWEITSHYICLSAHVVIEDRRLSETHPLRTAIASRLQDRFGIGHAVIQFECRYVDLPICRYV